MSREFTKPRPSKRFRSVIFLLPAWYAPTAKSRTFFHRLRGVKIGEGVEIGYHVNIENLYPHLVQIDDGATVTAGCVIAAHDASYAYARGGEFIVKRIHIREKAFIGVNSVILPGVTVGKRAIVGAGSVVIKDVEDDTVVAGVPARRIDKEKEQV